MFVFAEYLEGTIRETNKIQRIRSTGGVFMVSILNLPLVETVAVSTAQLNNVLSMLLKHF